MLRHVYPRTAVFFTLLSLILVTMVSHSQPSSPEPNITLQHNGVVTVAAWSPDGMKILSGGEDGMLSIWEANTGESLISANMSEPVRGAFWSDDGRIVVFWTDMGHLYHIDTENGIVSEPLPVDPESTITGAAWYQNGVSVLVWIDKIVYSPTFRGTGWSASTLRLVHNSPVVSAAFNARFNHIQTFTEDGTAHIWDAATQEEITSYEFPDLTRNVVFNQAETLIAAWTTDGRVILFDTETQSRIEFSHRTFVNGARFNTAESQLMSWAADDRVKVWNIDNGQLELQLVHNDWVNGAIWNAEQTRILSWAFDQVWIWDGNNGELLAQLPHVSVINGAAFHPHKEQVLSWGWDNQVNVWDVSQLMSSN